MAVCVLTQPAAASTHSRATHKGPSYPVLDYTGSGFDTCTAPSLAALKAWKATTAYRALGIYIGGENRACADGNLSASWVRTVNALGWRLAPLYVGRQAPCVTEKGLALINGPTAAQQGKADADQALAEAVSFDIGKGSAIYLDVEAYRPNNAACTNQTLQYIEAWITELHGHHYRAGVYSSGDGAIGDLVHAHMTAVQCPDALWMAHWDGKSDTVDPIVPEPMWSHRQRIKQFSNGHKEKHGGVTLNIDSDYFNGPVAKVV